ncbi:hypothetical protein ACQ86B_28480 (plasmid) [Mycolicibacterium aichiense]|uniref:hypothetical protein n=1 Tax=Mycolicibacterium aichiense TaxID=1799 RepID=UPI003D669937
MADAQDIFGERVRLFGARHNTVADAGRVYATVLMETGRFDEAEEVLLSVLGPSPEMAAKDPSSVDSLIYLSRLHRYQSRLDDARGCLRLATEAAADFEAGHLSLQAIEFEHSRLLIAAGDIAAGIDRLHDLESLQRRHLQTGHPELARTQAALSAVMRTAGDAGRAVWWEQRSSATAEGTDAEHEIWRFAASPSLLLRVPS